MGGAAVREKLTVAVTNIESSLGGCHREKVIRDSTDCPSSNQHHYVRQQPHRCEVLPSTTRKRENKGNLVRFCNAKYNYTICDDWDLVCLISEFLKSEETRVKMAMLFVSQCNEFTRQKAGGWKPAPSLPKVIGQSCLMCVTRGTCLGSSCFGDRGRCF